MSNEVNSADILLYEDADTKEYVSVIFSEDNFWLSQLGMAELFGCTPENVLQHLNNIFEEEELVKEATTKKFLVVRQEGKRNVRRNIEHYNLDAIISVGYRVNSILGVKFRQWATNVLKEYLMRRYSVNARMNQLEDRMDRRLSKTEGEVAEIGRQRHE